MSLTKSILAVAAALAFAGAASAANEVIVTGSKAANSRVFAFDLATDGNVAGFEFQVEIPQGTEKAFNLNACVSDLPKDLAAKCAINGNGRLHIFVFSPTAKAIPAGVLPIGKVSLNARGVVWNPNVTNVIMADTKGQESTATVQKSID